MFVLQTENGQILTDMGKAIFESISFEKWLHPDTEIQYRLQEDTSSISQGDIPVGSIEWTEQVSSLRIVPTNLPLELWEPPFVLRGRIGIGTKDDLAAQLADGPLFVKSATRTKAWDARVISTKELSVLPEDEKYFFSNYVIFTSEWRIFIFCNKIEDVKQYLGSWTEGLTTKDVGHVLHLCSEIKLPFPAYTIDIGRTAKGLLELIEIHPFISCGLYGFDNLPVIRRMAAQAWRYFVNSQNG